MNTDKGEELMMLAAIASELVVVSELHRPGKTITDFLTLFACLEIIARWVA